MTTIALKGFGGEHPKTSDQKLKPAQATVAKNCLLLSGDLVGLHVPELVMDFSADVDDVKQAFRIPTDGDDLWMRFPEETVHLLKGTLIEDKYDRHYWTASSFAPQYNTLDRMKAGDPSLMLGVPRPGNAPNLSVESALTNSWVNDVSYVIGDVVVGRPYGQDMLFVCIVNTTGVWVDENWQQYDIPEWSSYRRFDLDEFVYRTEDDLVYTANDDSTGPADWDIAEYTNVPYTTFSAAAAYSLGDWVEYSGALYSAIAAITAGAFDPAEWYTRRLRRYLVETDYTTGDNVIYQNVMYTASEDVVAGKWNSHQWDVVYTPVWDEADAYLVDDYAFYLEDDTDEFSPVVIKKANTTTTVGTYVPGEWDDTGDMSFNSPGTFVEGELISKDGAAYRAKKDITLNNPEFEGFNRISWSEGLTVTRAYLYTFVTAYGEEGAPSEPVVADGPDNGAWLVFNIDPDPEDGDSRAIKKVRIYRTITGNTGAADYFFVDEVDIGTTEYLDDLATNEVSFNDPLESYMWVPPPPGLQGIVTHPNGFMVGYDGRDVYFSEPYRPHAWPAEYALSTEYNIIGLGIFGTSIAVLTDGHPYISTGIMPASLTLIKIQSPEPCIAEKGIVPVLGGVLYPSTHGLMLIGKNGVESITGNILSRDEWAPYATPLLQAARYNDQYIGFHSATDGMLISPSEPLSMFSQLSDFWEVEAIWTDPHTGEVYFLQNKIVMLWNPPAGLPLYHTWQSMDFVLPKPTNLGAYQIDWRAPPNTELDSTFRGSTDDNAVSVPVSFTGKQIFNVPNTSRVGDVYNKTLFVPTDEDQLDGEELAVGIGVTAAPGAITESPWLILQVWCDGILRFETPIKTTEVGRLPCGFKARRWKFKFIGNGTIKTAKFANTGLELANV